MVDLIPGRSLARRVLISEMQAIVTGGRLESTGDVQSASGQRCDGHCLCVQSVRLSWPVTRYRFTR